MYTRKMEGDNINDLIDANGNPIWIDQWGLPMLAGIHTEYNKNIVVKIFEKEINTFLIKTIFETYTINKNDNSTNDSLTSNLLETKPDLGKKQNENLNTKFKNIQLITGYNSNSRLQI